MSLRLLALGLALIGFVSMAGCQKSAAPAGGGNTGGSTAGTTEGNG